MISVSNNSGDIRTQIFYFNDLHANIGGAKRLKSASDEFDAKIKQQPEVDHFKFCAGDSYIGRNKSNFIGRFLNSLNLDGMAPGNHEFDMGTKQLSSFMDNNLFKTFVANVDFKKDSNLSDDIESGRLIKSAIVEKNGHKYGIVGATAADMLDTISVDSKEDCQDVEFLRFEASKNAIQEEVDNLKKQGINKIILISHLGIERDQKLAKETDGIDIIVGGHSHTTLDGVVPDKNYFASKSGEPVLIVQAGQNGEKYGLLDVIFSQNGILKGISNMIKPLNEYNKSLVVDYIENVSMPKKENLSILTSALPIMSKTFEEHPLSCFVADAMREKTGAQIAFHNKGCQKIALKPGMITNRDVQTALPYINSVSMYKMSEKDIIDAINITLHEKNDSHKISNMQVSGMTYTIGKDGELKDVYVLDGDKKIKIDEKNPSPDKYYTVAYGAFFAGGPGDLKMLNAPEKRIKKFDWFDQDITIELIKKRSVDGKIDIKCDGRIKVEK